ERRDRHHRRGRELRRSRRRHARSDAPRARHAGTGLRARRQRAADRERLMHRALLLGVLAALALAGTAAAFTPTDPIAAKQWYLQDDHAFDAWPVAPTLAPVRVAIVDSGLDNTLPDFAGRILDARSFVGGSPYVDT